MTLKVPDPKKAKEYFAARIAYTMGPVELDHVRKNPDEKVVIIDVRAKDDFEEGHVPGAINLPQDRWDQPEGLEKSRINVVYCYSQVCHLAAKACSVFASKGFPVMEMEGGMQAWRDHKLEVATQRTNGKKQTMGRELDQATRQFQPTH